MTIHIPYQPLTDFCGEIFARAGCGSDEANRVAASLVDSNLTGHDSHGVIRVPRYVDWMRSGDLVPNQTIERVVDTPVIGVVDGRFGFGQIMAPAAVDIGVQKAKAAGLSAISLRNSGHVGRVGEWAERAAAAGLISIHFVNAAGSILVAPFGGLERRLSTAPFSVGVPRKNAPPVILDFATSLVAEGKVNVASHGGKPLPREALVGPDGTLSGDPALIYGPLSADGARDHTKGEGAIRAFGEHKGSGLALLCELLGGSLTGNGATEPNRKFANGMFSLYLDPNQIDPSHVFDADMTRYLAWFQEGKTIPGETILTPGEPERLSRAKRGKSGVPLSDEAWALIVSTARSVGVNRDLSV
jgi:hydroxycarboxylate dehydrogenase B